MAQNLRRVWGWDEIGAPFPPKPLWDSEESLSLRAGQEPPKAVRDDGMDSPS